MIPTAFLQAWSVKVKRPLAVRTSKWDNGFCWAFHRGEALESACEHILTSVGASVIALLSV